LTIQQQEGDSKFLDSRTSLVSLIDGPISNGSLLRQIQWLMWGIRWDSRAYDQSTISQ